MGFISRDGGHGTVENRETGCLHNSSSQIPECEEWDSRDGRDDKFRAQVAAGVH